MEEDDRKHLEMIQGVINRTAANSFMLKGWSVTAATALLAFAAGTRHQWVALVALLPTAVFWALDGYYLALERRYIELFKKACATPRGTALYNMAVDSDSSGRLSWGSAVRSPAVWPIHGVVLLTIVAVACTVARLPDAPDNPTRVQMTDTMNVRVVPVRTAAQDSAASLPNGKASSPAGGAGAPGGGRP